MTVSIASTGVQSDNYIPGVFPGYPATSAKEILRVCPTAPSGYYWIAYPGTTGNQPVLMYCDMTGASAGSSFGGWMRLGEEWFNHYARIMNNNENANNVGLQDPTIRLNYYQWNTASSNGTFSFQQIDTDNYIKCIKIRLPAGTRGVRVTRFDFYSASGPDGAGFPDSVDDQQTAPTKQQIISAGDGAAVNLGANYTSFGIYVGDAQANGRRLFIGNSAAPWTGEVNGGYVSLSSSRFVQYDDLGSDADRLIFYQSDGATETYMIMGFNIWIR